MPSPQAREEDQRAPSISHWSLASSLKVEEIRINHKCACPPSALRCLISDCSIHDRVWRTARSSRRKTLLDTKRRRQPTMNSKSIPAANVMLKRVYEPATGDDGARVLVDRLWPRG